MKNKKGNKKKQNQQGFTLIELLAVITIMGILMMVAIPSVSRTIENSRRDAYANVAKSYLEAVRSGMIADNISCCTTAAGTNIATDDCRNSTVASALPAGTYFYPIATTDRTGFKFFTGTYVNSTKELMETGGKSPFGSAELYGYIKITKTVNATTQKTTLNYEMAMVDTGAHGFKTSIAESGIKRSAVSSSGQDLTTVTNALKQQKYCALN